MSVAASLGTDSQNPNDQTDEVEEDPITPLERLITMVSVPMTLKAATELDVFGIIARAGPGRQLSAAEIAAELPTQKRLEAASMLDRMLRLLATYSVLTCSMADGGAGSSGGPSATERVYGLTPAAVYLVPDEDGLSLAPYLSLYLHDSCLCSWSNLKDAVIEGRDAFTITHGMNAYDYCTSESGRGFNEILCEAMSKYSKIIMKKILRNYKGFEDVKQLVEVGGGLGHNVRAIVSDYPSIRGINFDLPHVIQHTVPMPGVEHVSGDMFETVPQGDGILLKWILHNWTDEFCLKLLKNCYASLPDTGKVIVVDGVLSKSDETSTGAKAMNQMDLNMMVLLPMGKERTREEFIAISNRAGFRDIKFVTIISNYWIIELYKRPVNC